MSSPTQPTLLATNTPDCALRSIDQLERAGASRHWYGEKCLIRPRDRQGQFALPQGLPAGQPLFAEEEEPALCAFDSDTEVPGGNAHSLQVGPAAVAENQPPILPVAAKCPSMGWGDQNFVPDVEGGGRPGVQVFLRHLLYGHSASTTAAARVRSASEDRSLSLAVG